MILNFALAAFVLPAASVLSANPGTQTGLSPSFAAALAQDGGQKSKKELRVELKEKMGSINKKDARALFTLALWAERKGLKVLCGLFPEDVPKTSYDVISIIYTLEYIEHPKLMLMECNRRLKPMGVLALQLKNFSYWAHGELLYRSKIGIWCPADIRSYTRTTIIRLLEMCRLKPLKITPSQITGHPIASSCLSLWTKMSGHIVSPSITVISRPAQEAGLVTRKNG